MLLLYQPYDCLVNLKKGTQLPFGPIHNLSQEELARLREYINENLAKIFIWHSRSPTNAPILFIKKKDGSL